MIQSRAQKALVIAIIAAALIILPASAASAGTTPFISVAISPMEVVAGLPVTVSGVSEGAGESVQVWVIGDNYLSLATAPVNADGSFSTSFDTTGLRPGTYYLYVVNPGSDGEFNLAVNGRADAIVDAESGATVTKISGTDAVQGDAVATALPAAINSVVSDDVYAKATFIVTGAKATSATTTGIMPGSDRDEHGCIGSAGYTWCEPKQKCLREWEEPCVEATAAAEATTVPTTAKSPLPAVLVAGAVAGAYALMAGRKDR
jgi:hypothetical protein